MKSIHAATPGDWLFVRNTTSNNRYPEENHFLLSNSRVWSRSWHTFGAGDWSRSLQTSLISREGWVFPTIKNDWCKKHSENLCFNKKNLASKVSLTETKIYRYLRMTSCSPDEKVPNCSSRTVWVPAGAFRLVPWIAIDHNVCCSEVEMPTGTSPNFLVKMRQKFKKITKTHKKIRMDPISFFSEKRLYMHVYNDVGFEPPGRLKCEGYCKDETPVSYKFYMLERSSKRTPTKPHHFFFQ